MPGAETRYLTPAELLRIAEYLDGDPDVVDYGVPILAAQRPKCRAMGREVYPDLYAKAACMAHLLMLVPALEHSNPVYGLRTAREFLARNSVEVTYKADAAAALASDVLTHRAGWRDVAAYLRGSSR